MGAGNEREFIDHLQIEELLGKLIVASKVRNIVFGKLLATCLQTGAFNGVLKYYLSSQFEEDAREYCAETEWVKLE